jgi:molybdate transport system substrate-binding protein
VIHFAGLRKEQERNAMIVKGADIHNSFDHQPEAPRLEPIAEGFRYPGYKYDHAVNAETRRSLSQSGWTAVLRSTIGTIVISLVLAGMPAAAASAAELKVLISGAVFGAVRELAGTFEAFSGHKLVIEYATVGKIADRVVGDDPIDVAILTEPFFDKLVSAGKMVRSTTGPLVRVRIGLAVRQGAPKPDISSVDAFKKMLLDAKYITYSDPATGDAAGVHMTKIIQTLGLAGELEPKTRLISPLPGQTGAQFLTALFQRGETQVAMAPMSVLLETRGGEIVGTIPAELQAPDLVYFAGTPWTCRQPVEAKAFIDFLMGGAAKAVYRTKGMDPD